MIKIRCIDISPSEVYSPSLTYGRVYEVGDNTDMEYQFIMLKGDDGLYDFYYRNRFVLLSDERDSKIDNILGDVN